MSDEHLVKSTEDEGPLEVTAGLLVIGNEILSGRTQDANLAFLGRELGARGIRLMEARVIPDDEAVIVSALRDARARFDYVFTTGGIGPTHDDITVDCVAKAFDVPVVVHPKAKEILENYYGDRINEARLRMARVPEGADLVENPVSMAPGIQLDNVFILAGVPRIMQGQFESLATGLRGGLPRLARNVPAELAESEVAPALEALEARNDGVDIGSYPYMRDGRIGTSLVLRGTDGEQLDRVAAELVDILATLGVETQVYDGEGG
ncbi:competence/damage-inducible protein A [Rhodovibrionaceae bacterium A322]